MEMAPGQRTLRAGVHCMIAARGVAPVSPLLRRLLTMSLQGAPASEAAVRRLFQQLVVGLAFCHRQVSNKCYQTNCSTCAAPPHCEVTPLQQHLKTIL